MKLLVNYQSKDKDYLPALSHILRGMGLNALSTAKTLSIGELLQLAKMGKCDAIIICNEDTLSNCVPGSKPTLDKWRGSRLNYSIPTFVINSLSHIHLVAHGDWLLKKDLSKLKRIHEPVPVFEYTVLTETKMFSAAFKDIQDCLLMTHDIETRTLNEGDEDSIIAGDTIITCAGWTILRKDGSLYTYVLPLVDFDGEHWKDDISYSLAILLMQKINKLPQRKCMHNGMYDCTHDIRYHAEPVNYTLDTMALAHAEYAELPKTLDFVASYHLPYYVFWKDDAESAAKDKDIQKYWAYNGKDCWHTMLVLLSQLRTMPAYARKNYVDKFKLVYPSLYCAFEGFKINQEKRSELRAASKVQLEESMALLRTYFADPNFNPGSWQQVEKYIYRVFGASKPKIGKSKSCTDEKNLKAVAEQHPLLARLTYEILRYKKAQKAIGTYYDFRQYLGRLLWALNPWGTETERMACNSSSLWCGTQVQNIPSYAKAMLEADEGFEIAEADEKQAEARCTAYLAQETKLIQALEDDSKDFYKTLGVLFFQMKYEDITDFFRNKVLKKIQHGTNYMMGGRTFIDNIGVFILHEAAGMLGKKLVPKPSAKRPEETTMLAFANATLDVYHKPFPRIREWYKEIKDEVKSTGKLQSPLGHVRFFFGNIDKNHQVLRSAVAHQPQNLSVSILNIGFWRVYKEICLPSKGEFRLKAQIHDSILAQWKKEKRDYYAKKMLECMDNPVTVHGRRLSIPVDLKVGKVWAEKSESNPEGTDKYKVPLAA